MKFLCWDAETQVYNDALRIEADTAEKAAREYAEQCYWEDREDSREVAVARIGAAKATVFSVDIEITLDSYAMKGGSMPILREIDEQEATP